MIQRYEDPKINRAYWLTDALIHVRSWRMGDIDKVAYACTDQEVEAFCKIIAALNAQE